MGLCCCVWALSSCGAQASIAVASLVMELGFYGVQASAAAASGLSSYGSQALEHENSVFVAQGLSFPAVCGIFLELGLKLCLLH